MTPDQAEYIVLSWPTLKSYLKHHNDEGTTQELTTTYMQALQIVESLKITETAEEELDDPKNFFWNLKQ